jgi:hypothetical protein
MLLSPEAGFRSFLKAEACAVVWPQVGALAELVVEAVGQFIIGWSPGRPLWLRLLVQGFWLLLLVLVIIVAAYGLYGLVGAIT